MTSAALPHLAPYEIANYQSGYPVYNGRAELSHITLGELNRMRAIWGIMERSVALATTTHD